ncbi:M23 family metallopeptidase [[Brevibacterium] frigoritolerans]|uniref:M23 family metallopeptidase n=1 Tax=Peribacillus frigoritolerans TaxID=450367 RepID=A0A941JA63_9BACI|nr:M23 family metallopeptidase [Peribacillus frigoritolerans]
MGKLHKGIDIARPATRTITAADHGIIETAGNSGGYGNKITINHNNGYKTVYAHLDSIDVKRDKRLKRHENWHDGFNRSLDRCPPPF